VPRLQPAAARALALGPEEINVGCPRGPAPPAGERPGVAPAREQGAGGAAQGRGAAPLAASVSLGKILSGTLELLGGTPTLLWRLALRLLFVLVPVTLAGDLPASSRCPAELSPSSVFYLFKAKQPRKLRRGGFTKLSRGTRRRVLPSAKGALGGWSVWVLHGDFLI
jgi:hypothetical protein